MSVDELKSLAETSAPKLRTADVYVADVLRDAIVAGILKSGLPLRQDEVAAAFGVSRIPVREALRRLEAEGFVEMEPHKGASVALLCGDEALEISEMRAVLEVLGLRLSLLQLTQADLDHGSRLLDELDQTKDLGLACKLHLQFHLGLYSRCGRKRLLRLIESLHLRAERYLRFQVGQLAYGQQGQAEHRRLLSACTARNVPLACSILEQHILVAGEKLVAFILQQQPEE